MFNSCGRCFLGLWISQITWNMIFPKGGIVYWFLVLSAVNPVYKTTCWDRGPPTSLSILQTKKTSIYLDYIPCFMPSVSVSSRGWVRQHRGPWEPGIRLNLVTEAWIPDQGQGELHSSFEFSWATSGMVTPWGGFWILVWQKEGGQSIVEYIIWVSEL
jgi:hypothetical protein